ncbi:uncharacterized protein LOC135400864 isoform X2 [Ornithodoros turicata]|uniref:uncharacterized protein LOC135400864 isoform X2 n=1 Tax=Ornithodoros turicata TaxID=34597 RepID=UPI0031394373
MEGRTVSGTFTSEIRHINSRFVSALRGTENQLKEGIKANKNMLLIVSFCLVFLLVLSGFVVIDFFGLWSRTEDTDASMVRQLRMDDSRRDGSHARKARFPLLCHLTSPSLLPDDFQFTSLPMSCICDYVILEINMDRDASCNRSSKVLLTFPRLKWRIMKKAARSQAFKENARDLYKRQGVRGFGLLSFHYKRLQDLDEETKSILEFFNVLKESLRAVGHRSKVANFFSIQPRYLSEGMDTFKRLFVGLERRVKFIILETFTKRKSNCVVEATSSWTADGVAGDTEPNVKSALDLILSVSTSPQATYVISFTLRATKFSDVSGTGEGIIGKECAKLDYNSYLEYCEHSNETERKTGARWSGYDRYNIFEFYKDSHNAYGFETTRTIEEKMRRAFSYVGSDRFKMGWMAFNVTGNVDNGTCGPEYARLRRTRAVIEEFNYSYRYKNFPTATA